jgi:hypothetical protein
VLRSEPTISPHRVTTAPLAAALCALFALPANAGFPGFESRGFPPERPNGIEIDSTPAPRLKAFRVNGSPVTIDGKLDEAVWQDADAGHGFLKWHPDRGMEPTEETIFKVAYDEEAIYFGIACLENDCANIASSLSRRDQIRDSDLVSIYVDPYHDKNTGYNFRVNPAGVQEDYYLFDNGDRDRDWDAVWGAETSQDDHGWYAEVRIPFSSVRYRPAESMTWGLQVYRYMHRRGEDTAWVIWDPEASGFISRFGEITEIEGVRPPRQLELLPYVVASATNPVPEDDAPDEIETFQNFGLDLKYGVTADLTLNATIQPDFGQVEADPTVVNRSPFEVFFEEKRPFFVEGARFFDHRSFNLFYSRRIGLDEEGSRIRLAGKLTGKAAGNVSVAGLYAATDITEPGQAHNLFKNGHDVSHYMVGRIGKDFGDGAHRIHFMQTAVVRTKDRIEEDDDERAFRDGFTTGGDFDFNFKDRTYAIRGSVVGSIVDPRQVKGDPTVDHAPTYGTGGQLTLGKFGGKIRGNLYGRWEHNQLDLNDAGFLGAPDEIQSGAWVGWRYLQPEEEPALNEANLNVNAWKGWLYAGRSASDSTGQLLWSYGPRHPQSAGGNVNGYAQLRNYWGGWFGVAWDAERTDRFITRGGPLMKRPEQYGGWVGFHSDNRRRFVYELGLEYFEDVAGGRYLEVNPELDWNAAAWMSHSLGFRYRWLVEKAEFLDNVDHANGTLGLGGSSTVFGDLDERRLELEVRSNVLFSRKQSLELWFAPFLAKGDFTNARYLRTPDSYDLAAYPEDGLSGPGFEDDNLVVDDFDDLTAAVNLNVVYRWEYRPGSTFYLVWTHGRFQGVSRAENPDLDHRLSTGNLFTNEPENTILAKIAYRFPI